MKSHHAFKSLDFSPEAVEIYEQIRLFTQNKRDNFIDQIRFLNEYGDKRIKISLHKDWSPFSFSLVWLRDNEFFMNGGLIYNKALETWSIHT
tara:strand:+ start:163 stop:438 length:276 start_codon:yes stop_codon:yes gene_type:complete